MEDKGSQRKRAGLKLPARTPVTAERTGKSARPGAADIESVLRELTAIRADMVADVAVPKALLDAVHPRYRDSAYNLAHYLVLRRHDLRPLQLRLAALGLSSLGRAESYALATVDAVLDVLHRLVEGTWQPTSKDAAVVDFAKGQHLLAENTNALLGPAAPGRDVRIMVTMPSEAAHEYTLVHNLVQQGMNCMRINCAHDDAAAWSRMIDNLKRAEHALGRPCRVMMDLAGPKLRTGPLEPGPAVVRIRPARDVYGRVTAPARVWLTTEAAPRISPTPADASLPVPADWMAALRAGVRVKLTDARGSKRSFEIVDVTEDGCWAETSKTSYIVPGTILRRQGASKAANSEAPVGVLAPRESALVMNAGDLLIVTRDLKPGRPATLDSSGRVLTPASIG